MERPTSNKNEYVNDLVAEMKRKSDKARKKKRKKKLKALGHSRESPDPWKLVEVSL